MHGLATWNPLPVIACITCVVSGRWGESLSSGHGFLQAEGHASCILESLFPTTVRDTQEELNQWVLNRMQEEMFCIPVSSLREIGSGEWKGCSSVFTDEWAGWWPDWMHILGRSAGWEHLEGPVTVQWLMFPNIVNFSWATGTLPVMWAFFLAALGVARISLGLWLWRNENTGAKL